MMSFAEKLAFSLLISLILSIFFSFFFNKIAINLPTYFVIFIEILFLSIPCFFYFSQTIDFIAGTFQAIEYYLVKSILTFYLLGEPVCVFSIFLSTFSFSIIALAIAYQREQSLEKAKLNFLGIVAIIFSFLFSYVLVLIYYTQFSQIMCVKLPKLPSFFRSFIEFFSS